MGFTFVLDRDTGESLFPVIERPVPASTVPGEEAWPTQPFPLAPPPLARQQITEADLTNTSPAAHAYALAEFRKYESGPLFTPPSLRGNITQPGHLGGSEWHGASFDPWVNVLYVNVNDAPTINRLVPLYGAVDNTAQGAELGRQVYRACVTCHGANGKARRRSRRPRQLTLTGRRAGGDRARAHSMPAFPQLRPNELPPRNYVRAGTDVPSTVYPSRT